MMVTVLIPVFRTENSAVGIFEDSDFLCSYPFKIS